MEEFSKTDLANEQWRDIFGYDGVYQISSLGRVRSLKFGKTRVLRPGKLSNGYLTVVFCKDGKHNTKKVHRLVAQAFIENDNIFNTEVNHINEDKTDNRVDNLEWCNRQYNNTYNDIQNRKKNSVRRKIKYLYDPNLSTKQNLEIFKSKGIECTRQTLWNLRKDLGLVKHKAN